MIGTSERVQVRLSGVPLEGDLDLPERCVGVVLFAVPARNPRHPDFAAELQNAGFGTLLIDLLTETEDRRYILRYDLALLTDRLNGLTDWLQRRLPGLPLGYFGESTGTAAALMAAVNQGGRVGAIVSLRGRPDLADLSWPEVETPTLLIVGGNDPSWIQETLEPYQQLRAPKELAVIPGAGSLFEEPGAWVDVAKRAADWYTRYLTPERSRP